VFGTQDAAEIEHELARFCVDELGRPPREAVFYESSVGTAAGLVLSDGARVVVKGHWYELSDARLAACSDVQRALAERGFPCPRPLLGPRPLGDGLGTVEELVDEGERRDAHEPSVRRALAEGLARLVETAQTLLDPRLPVRTSVGRLSGDGLWPRPHSRLFDFEATRRGTEWIDELGARALERLRHADGELVVGHLDWTTKHCRFVGDSLRVVYDWDSLGRTTEAELVGQAACHFTTTWYLDVPLIPAPAEARAFVAEYEAARGAAFPVEERAVVGAAAVYGLAYGARCESCGDPEATSFPAGSQRDGLARYGEELFEL
jgi:hypothetical protein